MTAPALVIGLGNPDRGDDGAGREIARCVAARRTGIRVLELDDPSDALDAWTGQDTVVVADTVVSGGQVGQLHVVQVGETRLPTEGWASGGTHALGIATAVELARALGRLPRRLVLVGVEGARFTCGAPMSAAVAAAVPRATDVVLDLVAGVAPDSGGRG